MARALFTFWPFVTGVLRRWGVPGRDAPDIAQQLLVDVVFRMLRRHPAERRRPVREWRAYLRVAARRAARRYRRREAARGECLGHEPVRDASGDPSPEDILLARDVIEKLDPSRSTAPERWRALHAFAVTGTPVAVIAQAEQVPPATIRTRILLARRDLRAALRRRRLM